MRPVVAALLVPCGLVELLVRAVLSVPNVLLLEDATLLNDNACWSMVDLALREDRA